MVPKLLFSGRMPYKRNECYRTGGIAHPYRLISWFRPTSMIWCAGQDETENSYVIVVAC